MTLKLVIEPMVALALPADKLLEMLCINVLLVINERCLIDWRVALVRVDSC